MYDFLFPVVLNYEYKKKRTYLTSYLFHSKNYSWCGFSILLAEIENQAVFQ